MDDKYKGIYVRVDDISDCKVYPSGFYEHERPYNRVKIRIGSETMFVNPSDTNLVSIRLEKYTESVQKEMADLFVRLYVTADTDRREIFGYGGIINILSVFSADEIKRKFEEYDEKTKRQEALNNLRVGMEVVWRAAGEIMSGIVTCIDHNWKACEVLVKSGNGSKSIIKFDDIKYINDIICPELESYLKREGD